MAYIMSHYDNLLKIVITGDSAVGKSCMLSRYIDNKFNDCYFSTIGVDFTIKTIEVDDMVLKLQIWDTAGQDRFRSIVNSYYRGSHIVLIAFDLSSRESFLNIPKWYEEVNELTLDNTKFYIVGCKSDLVWAVTNEEIKEMSDKLKVPWGICSASKGKGVDDIFLDAIRCSVDLTQPHSHGHGRLTEMTIFDPKQDKDQGCNCTII